MPKTTQTRHMEGSLQATQDYTSNSIPTSFIFVIRTKLFPVISQQSLDIRCINKKKDVKMGLLMLRMDRERNPWKKFQGPSWGSNPRPPDHQSGALGLLV